MTLTRFGLHFSSMSYEGVDDRALFARIAASAASADQSGFDSIWVPDHFHQNDIGGGPSKPMPEAYTLLAALATVTSHAMLGALVTPVTFRLPVHLAKTITTLDVISGGRAILGIGAGWDVDEHAANGVRFPGVKERQDRLEEAIVVCRKLFDASPVDHDGEFYPLAGAWNVPRPIQAHLPILVGGGGERRTLATAARYGDACNFFGDPETIRHKLAVLAEHAQRYDRDVATISTTAAIMAPDDVGELVDTVGAALDAGVDGVVLLSGSCPSPETIAVWGSALHDAFD